MRSTRHIAHALYDRLALKANHGPIGIGLIGIGGWGMSNATNIMRSRRFNIVGVHDIQQAAAQKFSERFRTAFYKDIGTLLCASSLDAVCITVPNPYHPELVMAASDSGKHIFIEKPLASLPEDCLILGQHCHEKGLVLQVGHQMQREPVFRTIASILDRGDLGSPLFAQGVYALNRRGRSDWRSDPE